MNGTHVLAFLFGMGLLLSCQLFAVWLLNAKKSAPSPEVAYRNRHGKAGHE